MATKQLPAANKMLTRKSSSGNILTSSSVPVSTKTHLKDYSLDKGKSLVKKSESCTKEHMTCEMKQGNNLVIEFSTAAYELSKVCIHEILYSKNFAYGVEKRDGLDLNEANVDTCYKIYNKKADSSCGKLLKFVINFYHTTSHILVNGSKIDIFVSDILEKLGTEIRARCDQLDIINTNIATAITKTGLQDKTIQNQHIQYNNEDEAKTNSDRSIHVDETESDNEVCETCPICQEQAYGKVIQCGECGEWHHYECLNISDAAIETLGSDDFICIYCTDNLKYSTSEKDNENSIHTIEPEAENPHISGNESVVCDKHEDSQVDSNQQNKESYSVPLGPAALDEKKSSNGQPSEISTKAKPKKTAKATMKVKKDDIADKSYILELENQINVLKSTLNLYEKSKGLNQNQPEAPSTTDCPENRKHEQPNNTAQTCNHNCCTEMKDKLQENRMRMLEMQMMQNLYINNALHIQLASQARPYYQNNAYSYPTSPVPGTPPVYGGPMNQGFWNHMPPPNLVSTHGYYQPNTPMYHPPYAMNNQARPYVYVPAPVIQPPQYGTTSMNVPVIPTAQGYVQQPPQTQPTFHNVQRQY